jgi:hypothetical protein
MNKQAGKSCYPSAATKPVKTFPGACRSQKKCDCMKSKPERLKKRMKYKIIAPLRKKRLSQICGTASFLILANAV